ncbi:MAG: restriction endonuclease subunit S, partial [Roseomonas sp.]|nr:restriction endonuclease subunit S [Roseomonas sp.]
MSVAPYPEYKDSGVEWIGKIPAHWQFILLKRAIDFTTGWTPPTGRDELYEGDNAWATIGDMSSRVIKETAKTISDEAIRLAGIRPSYRGSLLFSLKLSIGHVAFVERDLYTNEAIATFPANGGVELGFAYYAFPLFVTANAAENIYGAKLLNQELIRNARLVLPPPEEQSAIAAFLDQETGKIDALVAEQERLIALLKEKRQA